MGRLKCAVLAALSHAGALVLVWSDPDHFIWGDLADSLHTGAVHHEPFIILLAFFGTLFGILALFPGRSG